MEKIDTNNVCVGVDKTFCNETIILGEKILEKEDIDMQCEETRKLIIDILTDLGALHHAIITREEGTQPIAELQDIVDLANAIHKKTGLNLDHVFTTRSEIILEMVKIIQKGTDETKENA